MTNYRDPGATWLGSPNYSPGRPNGIKWIVLHTMVGTTDAANARFQNAAQQASAHYGVSEDGSYVQWVDEGDTAWHAGDFVVNQYAIGIEHEDGGDYNGVRPAALYAASSGLVAAICSRYGIPVQRGDYSAGLPGCIDHRTVYATGCPDALDTDRIIQQAQRFGPGGGTIGGDDMLPDERAWLQVVKTAFLGAPPTSVAGHSDADLLTVFNTSSNDQVIAQFGQDGYKYISALAHGTPLKTLGGGGTEAPEPAEPKTVTLHVPAHDVPGEIK